MFILLKYDESSFSKLFSNKTEKIYLQQKIDSPLDAHALISQ